MGLKSKFAKRLKELRKQRGLTQEKLAEIVNVATRHISFIETARSFPSSDLIERLACALNVSYSSLFSFNEELKREDLIKKLFSSIEILDDSKLKYLYKMTNELY